MKNKIKDALKQRYNNLGLSDEAFDGVASSVQTVVTDETLDNFVVGAETLLKQFQSIADKARSQKVTELEAQLKEVREQLSKGDADKKETQDISQQIADAVSAAVKPLTDELNLLKNSSAAKLAVETARGKFFENEYAKKFDIEANDAWERALEINEATGAKMSADELKTKAEVYFNKSVSRKGVDITKPFEAEKHDDIPDFAEDTKILQNAGLIDKTS